MLNSNCMYIGRVSTRNEHFWTSNGWRSWESCHWCRRTLSRSKYSTYAFRTNNVFPMYNLNNTIYKGLPMESIVIFEFKLTFLPMWVGLLGYRTRRFERYVRYQSYLSTWRWPNWHGTERCNMIVMTRPICKMDGKVSVAICKGWITLMGACPALQTAVKNIYILIYILPWPL